MRAVSRACACASKQTHMLLLTHRLTDLAPAHTGTCLGYLSSPSASWVHEPYVATWLFSCICHLAVRTSIRHACTDTIALCFVHGACIAQPRLAMELQRLQWLVSSETGERLSLLLFLDLQSTKAAYLHTYLHSMFFVHTCLCTLAYRVGRYIQISCTPYYCLLPTPSTRLYASMCKQLRRRVSSSWMSAAMPDSGWFAGAT